MVGFSSVAVFFLGQNERHKSMKSFEIMEVRILLTDIGAVRYPAKFMGECRSLWHQLSFDKTKRQLQCHETALTHKFCNFAGYLNAPMTGKIVFSDRRTPK